MRGNIFMTRLILIRHGETDYNLQNRYCGFTNPPLNNSGILQSKRLAAGLKDIRIDKVYSSDLKRAYQTAEIIFENNPIEKLADFREMNFGIFEGLRYEEIAKTHPKLYRNWISNPVKVKIPNGEGLKDLRKRVKQGLSFILSQNKDRTIALVAHGGPIRVVLCEALKFGLKMFWLIGQEFAALNIIDYVKESQALVLRLNDTSYLLTKEEVIL